MTQVRQNQKWCKFSGQCSLVASGHLSNLKTGDRIRVFGKIKKPELCRNPGEIDFRHHYRTRRILAVVFVSHPDAIEVIQEGSFWSPQRRMDAISAQLEQSLWRNFWPEQAPLASAILLGNRDQMDLELRDDFMKTGTIHLLAISGLHVAILAGVLFGLGKVGLMPLRLSYLSAMLFVIFYAWLTGFRPPVTRAAILITTFCCAQIAGKEPLSFNSLALAGILILGRNPTELFQVGAQLSFLAVGTLVAIQPWLTYRKPVDPLDRLIQNTRPRLQQLLQIFGSRLVKLLLASALVWMVTVPLVAHHFHVVSPISVLLNPILVPLVTIGLYGGMLVLLSGWLIPPLASVSGQVGSVSLWSLEFLIEQFEELEHSYFWVAGPSLFWMILFYGFLISTQFIAPLRLGWRWKFATIFVGVVVWLFASALQSGPDQSRLTCTMIDVGHGTSCLMELPNGKNILYDCGSLNSGKTAGRRISGVLWSRQIHHLDAVIVSHADSDHYNALPFLIERFSIGSAYVSPAMFRKPSPEIRLLFDQLRQAKIPIRQVWKYHQFEVGDDISAKVLHPTIAGVGKSDNGNSIVVSFEFLERTILLPGDLENEGMEYVTTLETLDTDVAMVPHHGSVKSEQSMFRDWAKPEIAIVSSGPRPVEDFEKVQSLFEESGASTFNTANQGAIRIRIDSGGIQVRSWLLNPWSD